LRHRACDLDLQQSGGCRGALRLDALDVGRGACHGCPSSALTLTSAVEEAIARAAPDIERIEAEGATAPSGLLQIEIACPVPQAG